MGENQNIVISNDNLGKLKGINSQKNNGYLVLLDIKDSTKRKTDYQDKWPIQTEVLYNSFRSYFVDLAKQLNTSTPIIKFIGDGLLAFYPNSYDRERARNEQCTSEKAKILVGQTQEFINGIHDEEEFCGLKLKTVIAYLTGIHIIQIEGTNEFDVLGRGIDFAFRLERFADITHIVVNEMLAKAFFDQIEKTNEIEVDSNTSNGKLFQIPCNRKFRGWDDAKGEKFFLLTNKKMIEQSIESVVSSVNSDNVIHDLFRFYVRPDGDENKSSPKQEIKKSIQNIKKLSTDIGGKDDQ